MATAQRAREPPLRVATAPVARRPARGTRGREPARFPGPAFDLARIELGAPPLVLQRKLAVGTATDPLEAEADRIANEVMRGPDAAPAMATAPPRLARKCACGGDAGDAEECPSCRQSGQLQRRALGDGARANAPPIVHEALRSPGRPLDTAARAFFEPRFGHDFGRVRIHADDLGGKSARAVNAVAYTVGPDIVFADGAYQPHGPAGLGLLAHELAHVVQQGQGRSGEAASVSTDRHRPRNALTLRRLTPDQFRQKLGATADEKTAIDTLFADKQFKGLWDYLPTCPSKPTKDLGPLTLEVEPGLKMYGVERFGGYFPDKKTLKINPTKPEHQSNPQELVDTVVHELIHAIDDLDDQCVKDGGKASPLAGAGTVPRKLLADVKGTPDEDKLLTERGPGASNPCEEFLDINSKAQQIVTSIIQADIKATKIGHVTLTFVNDALRNSPAALAEYKKCRDVACAEADADKRKAAIGRCAEAIINKYVTPPTPASGPTSGPATPTPKSATPPANPKPP